MAKNKNRKNAPAPQAVKKTEAQAKPAGEIKEAAESAVSAENNSAPQAEEKSSKSSSKKKKDDPDYINKTDFTYDFYDLSATVSKKSFHSR